MDITCWKLHTISVKHYQIVTFDIAGEAGFEPTSTVLETAELPLFYSPKNVRKSCLQCCRPDVQLHTAVCSGLFTFTRPAYLISRLFFNELQFKKRVLQKNTLFIYCLSYSRILVTCPAPTVRPPSRIAKRRPSLSATG